jgi:hypothetical protein
MRMSPLEAAADVLASLDAHLFGTTTQRTLDRSPEISRIVTCGHPGGRAQLGVECHAATSADQSGVLSHQSEGSSESRTLVGAELLRCVGGRDDECDGATRPANARAARVPTAPAYRWRMNVGCGRFLAKTDDPAHGTILQPESQLI